MKYSALYDARISYCGIYENGVLVDEIKDCTPKNFYEKCLEFKNVNNNFCIFLLGPSNNIQQLFDGLFKNFYVYKYDPGQREFSQRQIQQQPTSNQLLASINEIRSLVEKNQQKGASYSFINTATTQKDIKELREIKEKVETLSNSIDNIIKNQKKIDYLIEEIYNREPDQSRGASDAILEDMRNELSAYKNDFYLKSMQKPLVNVVIEIIERLYSEKNETSDNVAKEKLDKIIKFCETKIKTLNLRTRQSKSGDEFDGNTMLTFDDRVETEDVNLKGNVAYSISPAYFWTLPRVNNPGEEELLIKEEIVALYN